MSGTVEDYAAKLEVVTTLTENQLASLDQFRAVGFPGSSLSNLPNGAVSLPAFRRRHPQDTGSTPILTPAGPHKSEPLAERGGPRTGSTCAVVRSLIRNPGLPFANIRPLQLLVLWERQLREGELGPAILERVGTSAPDEKLAVIANERNYFALGQVAVTVDALLQALPDGEIRAAPTSEEIISEALYRLRKDSLPRTGWRRTDWEHLRYAFRRLVALDSLCPEPGDDSSRSTAAVRGAQETLDLVCEAPDPPADLLQRAKKVAGDISKAFPGVKNPNALQIWIGYRVNRCSKAGAFDPSETGRGVEHLLSRSLCWSILHMVAEHFAAAPERFRDLILGDLGPPHPYALYWTLEGIAACERAFRDTPPSRVTVPPADDLMGNLASKRLALVSSAEPSAYRVLAQALQDDPDTDMYRLGYHLAVAAKYGSDSMSDRSLRSGLDVLASRIAGGSWPKRDRFFVTRHGEAYGFAPDLATSLVIAFDGRPEFATPLESIVGNIVESLRTTGFRDVSTGGYSWATRLDSMSVTSDAWATGEVFSMLFVAQGLFAAGLARQVQLRYGGPPVRHRGVPWDKRDKSDLFKKMSGDIWDNDDWTRNPGLQVGERLAETLCAPLRSKHGFFAEYNLSGRADRAALARSGIIYGPPGTGKTTVVETLADFLGWPLVTLDPADFLHSGREGVASTAREIFRTLGSLRDVVVFMDEMEELVRHRAPGKNSNKSQVPPNATASQSCVAAQLDAIRSTGDRADSNSDDPDVLQRLWTTTFLTLLQQLHDKANVIFLVATNHFESIDPAVTRAGRFDFRLQLFPPSPPSKWSMLRNLIVELSGSQVSPELADRMVAVIRALTEANEATLSSGASKGPIMAPHGERIDGLVSQPVRFAFMTWAEIRRLASMMSLWAGEIPVSERVPTPEEIEARIMEFSMDDAIAMLNEFLPVAFQFNPYMPGSGTSGLNMAAPR